MSPRQHKKKPPHLRENTKVILDASATMVAVVTRALIGFRKVESSAALCGSDEDLHAHEAGAIRVDQGRPAGNVHVVVAAALEHFLCACVDGHLRYADAHLLLKL